MVAELLERSEREKARSGGSALTDTSELTVIATGPSFPRAVTRATPPG
jgi:hypothetical protein